MNKQETKKIIMDLESESYNLYKGIEAFLYRVLPHNTDMGKDYSMPLLGCLSNQAKLVHELAYTLYEDTESVLDKVEE
ncbi:MAG: hypothetical protein E7C89_02835 [Anaerococcus sp.]|uniref:hypothetical protein n=1 Tax=Anaerococcus sp. TaxID=1872515 RepID=UPI002904F841|nr:hypothetical protein [Anaerococcus sp.]MDU2565517.1 hypothetical protein [Anaerococcus sp.]